MAHIGFLCPPIPGHLNPIATLGRALAKRGHKTTVFQVAAARRKIESQKLDFKPLGDGSSDGREINAAVEKLGTLSGLSAIRFSIQCGELMAKTICEYGIAAIRSAGVDLLVVDQNEPAGGTVAQHLKLPFVNVVSLPLNREPKMPPPFVPWNYTGKSLTTILNGLAYGVFDTMVAPINRVLNQYRREWGLPPVRRPDDTFSGLAQLSQLVEEFDFPRIAKPPSLSRAVPGRRSSSGMVPI